MKRSFSKLFSGLRKTRESIVRGLASALSGGRALDDDALLDIEETLIQADLGVETAAHLAEHLRRHASEVEGGGLDAARSLIASELVRIVSDVPPPPDGDGSKPKVIMVVGVNGAGKTTTIGKLAGRFASEDRSVLLAASDTFRAAAVDQLAIWSERSGAAMVGGQEGGDPAAVAFDALEAAMARGVDVLIIDTAGRLHTQRNLMQELVKTRRVLERRLPGAPHEVLLVLDANTGQNALSQTRLFNEALGVTGLVLAKLDGTARGGIVVPIARELGIGVHYVGVGEGMDDLLPFDAAAFAKGLIQGPDDDAP